MTIDVDDTERGRLARQTLALQEIVCGVRHAPGQGAGANAMTSPAATILVVDDEIQNCKLLELLLPQPVNSQAMMRIAEVPANVARTK
jgi:hypothetical protein